VKGPPLTVVAATYRFGRFELNPSTRQVLVDEQAASLGARAFDVLQALIERRDRLVAKAELIDLVWPAVVVEENNLQVQISALRKILGAEAIATVPGRGYRFALPVEADGGDATTTSPGISRISAESSFLDPALRSRVLTSGAGFPERLPPLFGRAMDLAALRELLSLHELVTIVGPGGIGKTRLAVAVADVLRDDLMRSVGWVDLAPLADPTLIPATIAGVFGLSLDERRQPLEALVAALKKRSLLIVLDNCEHLTDAVAMIASALLAGTQDVRLLATSRASLRIPDEQLYRLGPLTVPAGKASAQEAAEHGAVALFVARARAVDRRFEINEKSVAAVVEVCAQLDGIPLAIELAAARLPVLGLPALITMLDKRLRLLSSGSRAAPARQQTMLATFDWSYGLLSEIEKVVFRQLGIFAGGFTLEAVRCVVRSAMWDQWDVVDALGGLVEKSMVVVEGDESPRYRLLETGRAYALEKLSEGRETGDLERRHAAYFRQFFDLAYEAWLTSTDAEWRVRTDPELDNLRAALNWSLGPGNDVVTGIAIASASLPVWLHRDSHFRAEGRRHVRAAVAHLNRTIAPGAEARLWFALLLLLPRHSDADDILASAERAVSLCRAAGNDRDLCHALLPHAQILTRMGRSTDAQQALDEAQALLKQVPIARLQGLYNMFAGFHRIMTGDPHSAGSYLETALRLFEESGAENLALQTINRLADRNWMLGDLDSAVSGFRDAVVRGRNSRFADKDLVGLPLANLAAVLIEQGKLEEATPVAHEALALQREAEGAWLLFDALALRLALSGKHEDAARLVGFVNAMYEAGSQRREPNEERLHAKLLALLRERFSEAELEGLLRAGAELDENEAYRIAL
jgi:predicted ATPase/DNA-binding winged helix-turn-helix (wHTH) protein